MTASRLSDDGVFDDCVYEEEVLLLGKGSSESEIDDRLASQAESLGISVPSFSALHNGSMNGTLSRRTSTSISPSRSGSIDSRRSQTMSVNSAYSCGMEATQQNIYSSRLLSFSGPSINEGREDGTKSPASELLSDTSSSYAVSVLSPPLPTSSPSIEEEGERKPFSVRRGLNRLSKNKRLSTTLTTRGYVGSCLNT